MVVKDLYLQPYESIWEKMKTFTQTRTTVTEDECWLLEHPPVYTQGQAGKAEHLLKMTTIPIIQSDRGGQITYHGPGQLVAYFLYDLKRAKIGIRTMVSRLENLLLQVLQQLDIVAQTQCGAPGVYINNKKIASIGLRVKNGCTYHGIALNVNMDMRPFANINPCGFVQLQMTQIKDYQENITMEQVKNIFCKLAHKNFN